MILIITGCARSITPPANSSSVPLYVVISQMKCEFARSLSEIDPSKIRFEKWQISGKLVSKIITGTGGKASFGTPSLVPIGSGGTASGSFGISASATKSFTNTTTTTFSIDPQVKTSEVCDRSPLKSASSLGIYDWMISLNLIETGEPKIGISKLNYVLDFGVKYTADANATLLVVPVKIQAGVSASRNDVQTLSLELVAPKNDLV
ncbi:unnamed protein product, partial [Ectocarpus sp. 12 AP-2014]